MNSYLIGTLGIAILLGLSAFGSCEGISQTGTASILFSKRSSIITQAYVGLIMASTVFMYGIVLSMSIMFKITDRYTIETALIHFTSCMFYGVTAYLGGKTIGSISKNAFKVLNKNPNFFFSYVLVVASVEVTLIFSLIFAMLLVYGSKIQ